MGTALASMIRNGFSPIAARQIAVTTLAVHCAAAGMAFEIITARREDFDRVRSHLKRERRILRQQLERLSRLNPELWLRRWCELAESLPVESLEKSQELLS